MEYRRGFKSEAHAIAREVRDELHLGPYAPLDPLVLAAHLEIPVIPLSRLTEVPGAVQHFTVSEPECFSAVTVFDGRKRIVIHNDAHAAARQASNIAHELAHGLLLHPSTPAIDDRGCRHWNDALEKEADYLGSALLVTEETALRLVERNVALPIAAEIYGVSVRLLRWRLNATGAYKRIQRRHRSY